MAIVASAFLVFLLSGMNSPEIRTQMELSREGERLARALAHTLLSSALSNGGQLRWRIFVLIVLLGAISLPLMTALKQVAGEAIARSAVQEVVGNLVPRSVLVSQQVEIGRKSVLVRLPTTKSISEQEVKAGEQKIRQLCGRDAAISVASIASQSELSELMQRLSVPSPSTPPPVPAEKTLAELQTSVIARLSPVVAATWPKAASLKTFNLECIKTVRRSTPAMKVIKSLIRLL